MDATTPNTNSRPFGNILKTVRTELVKQDFFHNQWELNPVQPVKRHFFNVGRISKSKSAADGIVGTAIAQIDPNFASKCVFCNGDGELLECEIPSRKGACNSRYHLRCAMKYNADGFQFQYASFPECQNRLLCPLHCCATCNSAGRKQTAYAGTFLECAKCLRSFHPGCVPDGWRTISVKVGNDSESAQTMVVCSHHQRKGRKAQNLSSVAVSDLPKFWKEIPRKLKKPLKPANHLDLYKSSEIGGCGCTGPNRCSTNACKYRADGCECSESCASNGESSKCSNKYDQPENLKIEVFKTDYKGYGVRATEPIRKGEMIVEYLGEMINTATKNARCYIHTLAGDKEGYNYVIQTALPNITIDATRSGNIARVINHSCEPNAKTDFTFSFLKECKDEGSDWSLFYPRVFIVAARDIEVGEEINFNYKMTEREGKDHTCFCGAASCTGTMSGKTKETTVTKKMEDKENIPVHRRKGIKRNATRDATESQSKKSRI